MDTTKAEFKASYGLSSQLPERDRAEIVFSGRSNVGKSSLINKLCNRKSLARVSSTPGKTATINFYTVGGVYLVDLPGYGYAKVAQGERQRWDKLINSYFERGRRCALLVQLLDSRHAPSADDEMMLEYLAHHEVPFVAALTKADKLKKSQYAETAARFAEICAPYGCRGVVLTSADNGYGIPELRDVHGIFQRAEVGPDGILVHHIQRRTVFRGQRYGIQPADRQMSMPVDSRHFCFHTSLPLR